ncbi:UNVERIFIED_CONTAM: Retrovirus-related Pol polyprotein from transposon TNT 1-94 [Sesamum indicum]
MTSSEVEQWKVAIKSEMDSTVSNGKWELVNLPLECTTIGYKFKAKLMAKGFIQKEVIDYFITYSPIACLTTIRVLIALASVYNLSIHQMNVKTTFPYRKLEEEIHIDQLEGFVHLLSHFMD